jgi:hypothetical protein
MEHGVSILRIERPLLKMEAAGSSETVVYTFQIIRPHNPENSNHNISIMSVNVTNKSLRSAILFLFCLYSVVV